jgi:hypothetical protein
MVIFRFSSPTLGFNNFYWLYNFPAFRHSIKIFRFILFSQTEVAKKFTPHPQKILMKSAFFVTDHKKNRINMCIPRNPA